MDTTPPSAQSPETDTPRTPRGSFRRRFLRPLWREWVRPFFVILVLMGSFRSAVADWNHVPTGSMKPTILVGDRIFVNKLAYDLKFPFTRIRIAAWADPDRGDLIVFRSPADRKRLVKRVVGLPGDEIELRDNRLIVNGEPADYAPLDPEIVAQLRARDRARHQFATEKLGDRAHPVMTSPRRPSKHSFGIVTVPEGHYFVMGDNRDESFDSRWFGFVQRRAILGKATAVAISMDPKHFYLPRWHRFFSDLP